MLHRHRELVKFAVVGGVCFVLTNLVNYGLKFTVLSAKPVVALGTAVLISTVVSYVLSREWSFRTRGGRERSHEAALFFLISGIGIGINALPLAVSRWVLHLEVPYVGLFTQEAADFVSGIILGTLITTVFRWWAFTRWVFPRSDARQHDSRRNRALPEDHEKHAA